MQVKKGGPNVLEEPCNEKRSLFLCYPDDFEGETESLGLRCLHSYEGDVVGGFVWHTFGGWRACGRSRRLFELILHKFVGRFARSCSGGTLVAVS